MSFFIFQLSGYAFAGRPKNVHTSISILGNPKRTNEPIMFVWVPHVNGGTYFKPEFVDRIPDKCEA
jgi:hypothetical protein